MLSRINSFGVTPNYSNQVYNNAQWYLANNNSVQPAVSVNALTQDVFTPSVKPVAQSVLSDNEKIALEFGKDLKVLVDSKNATALEIQKLIQKHLKVDNVKIHPMSEYTSAMPRSDGAVQKAAVTRPNYDTNGKLINIDVFIPDVDYNDKHAVLAFVDKTVHEITHVAQQTKNHQQSPHQASSMEGRFMNFIQKRITDMLTDKGVTDTSVALIKEANYPLKDVKDYDNFMDSVTDKVTPEKIGEVMKFGSDAASQKQKIGEIFDMLFEQTLKSMQYEKDPNALATIQKYGGMEGFKAQIKVICAQSLKDEQEAYNAGNIMRKQINGVEDKQTYNDLIATLMGMYSQALA